MQKHTYMPRNIKMVRKFNMYYNNKLCVCDLSSHKKVYPSQEIFDLFKFEDTYQ